ncbi:PEGA domain-containing protein [Archangium lansingense]|uniref:PEGA domain-containing protein n=1 Tax=Archangium lansingense TaxID=2995310 RepID=UPI003B760513
MTPSKTSFMRLMAVFTVLTFTVGCASSTIIRSNPSGADVYIDGSKVGTTPYTYSDTKLVGASTSVKLTKEGYQDFETTLRRNEQADIGAIIGGIFLLVPFLWTMGYNPEHSYELKPAQEKPFAQDEAASAAPNSI